VLGALTIRSLLYVHDKAQMTLLRGRGGQRARPRS
jgi:hypothetical protein